MSVAQRGRRPHFVVTELMYQEGLKAVDRSPWGDAIDLPIKEEFMDPECWRLEPTRDGQILLGSLDLYRDDSTRISFIRHVSDSGLAGKRDLPANAPYESVTEHILTGGYTEERIIPVANRPFVSTTSLHAGQTTHLPHGAYRRIHTIRGATFTLLTCRNYLNEWGYYDPATKKKISAVDNLTPDYAELCKHITGR